MRSQPHLTKPMHELAICQSVLRQVLAEAAERNASHIGRITQRMGPLAGVEPGLARLAFPLGAAGPLARTERWRSSGYRSRSAAKFATPAPKCVATA